jgi:hypothetical protein
VHFSIRIESLPVKVGLFKKPSSLHLKNLKKIKPFKPLPGSEKGLTWDIARVKKEPISYYNCRVEIG